MKNTTKSVSTPGVKDPPLSGQAAACHSSTLSEKLKSDKYSAEELLQVGLILFNRLCREMLSGDAMSLAFFAARRDLEKSTIEPEKVQYMLQKYAELAESARKSNFMSGMF